RDDRLPVRLANAPSEVRELLCHPGLTGPFRLLDRGQGQDRTSLWQKAETLGSVPARKGSRCQGVQGDGRRANRPFPRQEALDPHTGGYASSQLSSFQQADLKRNPLSLCDEAKVGQLGIVFRGNVHDDCPDMRRMYLEGSPNLGFEWSFSG